MAAKAGDSKIKIAVLRICFWGTVAVCIPL